MLRRLPRAMPLVINEQPRLCGDSDCPDSGRDRALLAVTFLPQCVKQVSFACIMKRKRKRSPELVG